jgi:phosphatidylglycerophosphate synthase
MKWSEFKNICEKYFSNSGSTWYHREIELRGAKVVAFVAISIGMSPNVLTLFSTLFAVIGMVVIIFHPDDWMAGIFSLLLLQLCFIADCSDGILARFQNRCSKFGAFWDNILDTLNHYIVFVGFGIAWAIKSPEEVSLKSVILYVIGAILYTFYYETSMIRGHIFSDLKGTMEKFGQNWKERTLKIPYELINRGIHYLLLSIAYVFDVIFWMVLFYGILAATLTIVMVVYVYFKDAKKGKFTI